MTDDEAIRLLAQRWATLWPAASTPIVAEGVRTVYPNTVEDPPAPPEVWADFTIEHGQSVTRTLGTPAEHTTTSTLIVWLYYPAAGAGGAQDGTHTLTRLGNAAKALLGPVQIGEGPDENGVILYAASLGTVGTTDDDAWWILAVSAPFEYTDVR